jgi:ribosome-associated translation inhibitor RaiA
MRDVETVRGVTWKNRTTPGKFALYSVKMRCHPFQIVIYCYSWRVCCTGATSVKWHDKLSSVFNVTVAATAPYFQTKTDASSNVNKKNQLTGLRIQISTDSVSTSAIQPNRSLYAAIGFNIDKIQRLPRRVHLHVLYGSDNKQRLFHCTALTDWFLQPRRSVFTARYVLSTQCIYVFCVDLRTNSDYFTVQH